MSPHPQSRCGGRREDDQLAVVERRALRAADSFNKRKGFSLSHMLEGLGILGGSAAFGAWYYKRNRALQSRLRAAMGNPTILTAAGVVSAAALASMYFGAVMVKPRDVATGVGEGEDISVTSSGTFMRGHQLQARPDYGVGKDYWGYMSHIPSHVLVYAAPIILAPTAHIIVSMAQHSHALRKPLFAGALIASLGAIAQRLYLMKDSWAIKECGSDAEDEY